MRTPFQDEHWVAIPIAFRLRGKWVQRRSKFQFLQPRSQDISLRFAFKTQREEKGSGKEVKVGLILVTTTWWRYSIRFFLDSLFYFIFFINKQMAWKKHYFAKDISLDIRKECFATNVRETDFEVLIQESFLRIVKRNSVYEVTLSVADPGRGLGPPAPYFQTKPKNVFLFWDWAPHLSQGLDDRPPPPPPPLPPPEGLDPPLFITERFHQFSGVFGRSYE